MPPEEQKQAEAASWKRWQTAWGNTESGAHAFGWQDGYTVGQAELQRLQEQLRIATDQLQAFSDQEQERYPGELGTVANDALIRMSVVE